MTQKIQSSELVYNSAFVFSKLRVIDVTTNSDIFSFYDMVTQLNSISKLIYNVTSLRIKIYYQVLFSICF